MLHLVWRPSVLFFFVCVQSCLLYSKGCGRWCCFWLPPLYPHHHMENCLLSWTCGLWNFFTFMALRFIDKWFTSHPSSATVLSFLHCMRWLITDPNSAAGQEIYKLIVVGILVIAIFGEQCHQHPTPLYIFSCWLGNIQVGNWMEPRMSHWLLWSL